KREDDALGLGGVRPGLAILEGTLHPVEIAARGKGRAFASEDDDIRSFVARRIEKDFRKLAMHFAIDRIHELRIGKREREHAALPARLDAPVAREVDCVMLPRHHILLFVSQIVALNSGDEKRGLCSHAKEPAKSKTPAARAGVSELRVLRSSCRR